MNQKILIDMKNISFSYPMFNTFAMKYDSLNKLDNSIGGQIIINKKNISVLAISNINLSIYEGDKLGIVGLNGSGKTTLLRIISKIIKPNIGSLSIKGEVNSFLNIGFPASQDLNLVENIKLFMAYKKFYVSNFKKFYSDILTWANLENYKYLPFRILSPGMRARFFFALSTSIPSDILVIDEWLGVGDVEFVAKSKARFQEIIGKCKTLIISSHDQNILDKICNRIIHLKNGLLK